MRRFSPSRRVRRPAAPVALTLLLVAVLFESNACSKRSDARTLSGKPADEAIAALSAAPEPGLAPVATAAASTVAASASAGRVPSDDCGAGARHEDSIDDFEDADSEALKLRDQNGSWFIATDGSHEGEVHPAAGPAIPQRLENARCGSLFALHFSGQKFTRWGTVLGINPRFDKKPVAVDWSSFTGLRFWVRADANQVGVLRLNVEDGRTHPAGGKCSEAPGKAHPCWNAFGVELPQLSTDWQELRIPFATLTQKQPETEPSQIDLSAVYQLAFKTSPGNAFDFWVDDVALYR